MKKLFIFTFSLFLIPPIAFAAWWNPFTWNVFKKHDTKTQELEKKVTELEKKLNVATTTPSAQANYKESKQVPKNNKNTKINNESEKADSYVVSYSEDGTAVDWKRLDSASYIFNDTLNTYKETLPEFVAVNEKEKKTRDGLSDMIAKPSINETTRANLSTLLTLDQNYINTAESLISIMTTQIKNYNNLLLVIKNRDATMFRYYNDEIGKLEPKYKKALDSYIENQEKKQQYANSLLSN